MTRLRFVFVLLIFSAGTFAQNFYYSDDDWQIFTSPKRITAITENVWKVYFATDAGIFYYDKMYDDVGYEFLLSSGLSFSSVTHLFYDSNTDYFWLINNEGIYFRPSIASFWQTSPVMIPTGGIDDIGNTSELIWLKYMGDLIALDPVSGQEVQPDDNFNTDLIDWGYSQYGYAGRLNGFSPYIPEDGPEIDDLFDLSRRPTVKMQDSNNDVWFGTNSNIVYVSRNSSSILKPVILGSPIRHVTELHHDQFGNWWISDNPFKRTGRKRFATSKDFIYRWNEKTGEWKNYMLPNVDCRQCMNVNRIMRIGYFLYVGTMDGLLVLDIAQDEWKIIKKGLKDPAVWDMAKKDGKLYLGTARGISVVSLNSNEILTRESWKLSPLDSAEIYDLESGSKYLYAATSRGIIHIDTDSWDMDFITEDIYRTIHTTDSSLVGAGFRLKEFLDSTDVKELVDKNFLDFAMVDHYVWATDMTNIYLYNLQRGIQFKYDEADGIPGTKIYNIGCDEERVWFGTDNGFAIYKWRRYHSK